MAFEFRNDFLSRCGRHRFRSNGARRVDDPDSDRLRNSMRRGLAWLFSMQNADGGWGAFDHETRFAISKSHPFRRPQRDARSLHRGRNRRAPWSASGRWVGLRITRSFSALALSYATSRRLTVLGSGAGASTMFSGTSGVLRALETIGLSKQPDCQRAADWLRFCAECRWRLRRVCPFLLRSCAERQREEHCIANGLGLDRVARNQAVPTIVLSNALWRASGAAES